MTTQIQAVDPNWAMGAMACAGARLVPGRVLDGVTRLVRGDADGADGAAAVDVRRQSELANARVVVVGQLARELLDGHVEPVPKEELARDFRPARRLAGTWLYRWNVDFTLNAAHRREASGDRR
jgi:hypothetical protein